jgi:GNAT superfamily N-acetyltransferase
LSRRVTEVRRTYLEMLAPCPIPLEPAPVGVSVVECLRMSAAFYRFLYREVGAPWHWTDRTDWSDTVLRDFCQDPARVFYVLWVEGCPAGFAEFETNVGDDTQLRYFGLMAEFCGRGLGRFFLHWVCHEAWDRWHQRVWLHTCTLDSTSALPNYLSRGFKPFREELYHATVEVGTAPQLFDTSLLGKDSVPTYRTLQDDNP